MLTGLEGGGVVSCRVHEELQLELLIKLNAAKVTNQPTNQPTSFTGG